MSAHTPQHETDPDATTIRPVPSSAPADADPNQGWPTPPSPPSGARNRRPIVAAVVGTVVVLVGGLYLVGYLLAGDNLPKDAEVSGVPVGGISREAAIAKLTSELGPRAAKPIQVTVGGKAAEVDPAAAGLQVDYAKSVDAAGGGQSLNPAHILRVLTGGAATEAAVSVDEEKLSAAAQGLATTYDQKPANAAIGFDGAKVKRTAAEPGVTLEQEQAATALRDSFLTATAPVELPADVAEPEVTTAEADQVVADYAKPAVSGPVTVKAGSAGSFSVSPAMIGDALTFEVKDGTLAPSLNAEALRKSADSVVKKVELTKPRNATVRIVNGKPKVIAAVNGTAVSADGLAKAVEPVLTKSGGERQADVELTGAKAKFTTADAEKLGVKQVTGEFTTYFPYANYRNVNIGRAAELINGTLLEPGETFSLNGIVGERTAANGFTEGNIITGGKFRLELGGGVSQSATTTYNAMFFAGLKDIEHQPHTLFIDRYPPGREATVAWPNLDLKFQNDTKYGVLVQASVNKATPGSRGSITVKMWSTKTYDKITSSALSKSRFTTGRDLDDDSPKCQPMSPVQGFDVDYQRLFYRDGSVVKRENFNWRYAPTDRVRCT